MASQIQSIKTDADHEDDLSPRINKRNLSPATLAKLRKAGSRGGKARNPNKGFGSNKELAKLAGRKSKRPKDNDA